MSHDPSFYLEFCVQFPSHITRSDFKNTNRRSEQRDRLIMLFLICVILQETLRPYFMLLLVYCSLDWSVILTWGLCLFMDVLEKPRKWTGLNYAIVTPPRASLKSAVHLDLIRLNEPISVILNELLAALYEAKGISLAQLLLFRGQRAAPRSRRAFSWILRVGHVIFWLPTYTVCLCARL